MTTSLGLSAGSGMIHCVLLTTDDNGRQSSVNRVIDVDLTDGLTRAGRVNSGIDLMLGNANDQGVKVGAIGVAHRTDEHAREIASRGTGAKRQIQLIAETEAVAHQLRSTGEIGRFGSVVVVDLGDSGMSMYMLDPKSGETSDHQRSQAISGAALDSLLVQELTGNRMRGRRRSTMLSACRTAKEDLSVSDSTSLMSGGSSEAGALTRSVFEGLARPMAVAASTAVADYAARTRPEAMVLIGGIANIPLVRNLITERVGVEVVLPVGPESVAATGAARLAAAGTQPAALAFIGGRRSRDWLSAAPLAMFGALLAGALMTVYAVGSSLAGNPSTPASPSAVPTAPSTTTTTAEPPVTVTSLPSTEITPTPAQIATATTDDVPSYSGGSGGGNRQPGWATTELPPPPGPTEPPTRTLSPSASPSPSPSPSLIPFPLPTITWPPTILPPTTPPSTTPPPPESTTPSAPPPETIGEVPPPADTGTAAPAVPLLVAPSAPAGEVATDTVPTSPPAS